MPTGIIFAINFELWRPSQIILTISNDFIPQYKPARGRQFHFFFLFFLSNQSKKNRHAERIEQNAGGGEGGDRGRETEMKSIDCVFLSLHSITTSHAQQSIVHVYLFIYCSLFSTSCTHTHTHNT